MVRQKTEEVELRGTKRALINETEDTIFNLDESSYLERKKGTTTVTLHRNGVILDLAKATNEDFDLMYVEGFFENVTGAEKLQIDKSMFYTDAQLHKLSRRGVLELSDALTNNHCDRCSIKVTKGANITLSNYCSLACSVGIEIQTVGAVFEQRGRLRIDRGKRIKKDTELESQKYRTDKDDLTKKEIEATRAIVLQRRLRSIKNIYIKLVSPKLPSYRG